MVENFQKKVEDAKNRQIVVSEDKCIPDNNEFIVGLTDYPVIVNKNNLAMK